MATAKTQQVKTGGVAADQLRSFIERIERLEEEKATLANDIKEVFAEAKMNGFDTPAMRQILEIAQDGPVRPPGARGDPRSLHARARHGRPPQRRRVSERPRPPLRGASLDVMAADRTVADYARRHVLGT